MTAYKVSDASLVRRVPKSENAPYGIVPADSIPADIPCFIAFGGELTDKEHFANSYASKLDELMHINNINGVDIYSVLYNFGSSNPVLERAEIFRAANRKIKQIESPIIRAVAAAQLKEMRANEPVPNYIKKLFDIIIRPRIMNNAGNKRPAKEVLAYVRNLKFYAHCHGAAAIMQLAEMMHSEMLRLGYTPKEINEIQKEVLVVQHSPLSPLDKLRFTTLSFASAEDTQMQNHANNFARWIGDNSADVPPSFFGEPYGNIFVAGHLKLFSFQEHDYQGLVESDEQNSPMTPDGKIIFAAERNAIVNGARHSVNGGPLPSVAKLVDGDGVNFEAMKRSGDFLFNIMLSELRQQNPKRGHQK